MASIRERTTKAGERTYSVLYRHGPRQASKTFADLKSAQRFKALVDALKADGAIKALAGDQPQGITVAQLWDRFITDKSATKGGVTERTAADYRRDYKNWVEPWFGHRDAETIDERDVQKWVDHMKTTHLSPKSIVGRHSLLYAMYDYGKKKTRRLVTHNPCEETDLPKRRKARPKGTTPDEFRAILTAAAKTKSNPDAADLILFLGETGWRFSEATGLHRSGVEDDGVDVWVSVDQVTRIDGAGRQYIAEDEAKSEAGFRRIRLLPDSAAMVRRRIIGLKPGGLVFTNRLGNHWNQNTWLRTTWPGIVKAAELAPNRKPTPHWLRHMHVVVMIKAGASLPEIQRRIGHEHISTTIDVYGGMTGDVSDDALTNAASLLRGKEAAGDVIAGEIVERAVDLLELD